MKKNKCKEIGILDDSLKAIIPLEENLIERYKVNNFLIRKEKFRHSGYACLPGYKKHVNQDQ